MAAWTSLSWLVELQDLDLLSDTPYQPSFFSDKNMKQKIDKYKSNGHYSL